MIILKSLFLCLVQIASFLFTCLQVYRLFLLSVFTLLYIMFLFFSGFWLWCALVGFKKRFILVGVWASWICKFINFIKFGNLSAIISYIFHVQLSLLFPKTPIKMLDCFCCPSSQWYPDQLLVVFFLSLHHFREFPLVVSKFIDLLHCPILSSIFYISNTVFNINGFTWVFYVFFHLLGHVKHIYNNF